MGNEGFEKMLRALLPDMGYQWRSMNRRNVRRKARRCMEAAGLHEWDVYTDLLKTSPRDRELFESTLRVTITRFFRNAHIWEALGRYAHHMASSLPPGRELLAWSAGCGGGEEPYSLNILLKQLRQNLRLAQPWQILATDTNAPSLDRTGKLTYAWGSVREVPVRLRERWFTREGELWLLDQAATEDVRFQTHDIVKESPPGPFDIVLLRNSILTYNSAEVQLRVLSEIRNCLQVHSLLIVGRKERVPTEAGFEMISECIYRRID